MINTEISRKSYTGDGSTTVFAYDFKIFAQTDLLVYVDNVLKTLTTHYTVSGVGLESGARNVTFLSAPASGLKIEIFRSVALKQLTDYVANDPFPAQTHEDTLDKIVQQVQMLKDMLRRVPKWAMGTDESTDLSLASAVAGANLKWSADGKIIQTGTDARSRVSVNLGSSQTISGSGVITKITLNSKNYDILNEFDATTNYRFTPSVAGGYLVIANVQMVYAGNAGPQSVYIQQTNADYIARQRTELGAGLPGRASVSAIALMTPSDYLELLVENSVAGVVSISGTYTKMEIIRLW